MCGNTKSFTHTQCFDAGTASVATSGPPAPPDGNSAPAGPASNAHNIRALAGSRILDSLLYFSSSLTQGKRLRYPLREGPAGPGQERWTRLLSYTLGVGGAGDRA